MSELYRSDELQHWGVKGMKWGVRRYRNADGSLTSEGKRRQDEKDEKYRQKQLKATNKYHERNHRSGFTEVSRGTNSLKREIARNEEKYRRTGNVKYKNVVKMAKSDLRAKELIKKVELTKVKDLTHDQIMKEKVAVGKAYTKDLLISVGASAVLLPTTGFVYGQVSSKQSIRSRMRNEN
jgi:hypothetical protein